MKKQQQQQKKLEETFKMIFGGYLTILHPTGRCRCVLPGAFDLEEDGVGVIRKQNTCDQTKHLRNNKKLALKLR